MKNRTDLNVGHVGSETRSLGQVLEKSCILSSRHSFDPICMKLCQKFDTIKFRKNLKLGHVGSKSKSPDQILEKKVFLHSKGLKVLF